MSKKISPGDQLSFKEDVQEALKNCESISSAPVHQVVETNERLGTSLVDNGDNGQEYGWLSNDNFFKKQSC